jgi:hypothetical protein
MQNRSEFENDQPKGNTVKTGGDRAFGTIISIIFFAIGLHPLWGGQEVIVWALSIGIGIAAFAVIYPTALHPINVVWCRFGLILHKVANPIVMGVLFFLIISAYPTC